jgi:hypothetical protein
VMHDGFGEFESLLKNDPLWDVYRLRAVCTLQDRVANQLQELYGSNDQVDAARHDGVDIRERAWHLATRLRSLESELLEKAYGCFEDQVCDYVDVERTLDDLHVPRVEKPQEFVPAPPTHTDILSPFAETWSDGKQSCVDISLKG